MGNPKLNLSFSTEHTISLTTEGASDSVLLGQLSFSNILPQCEIQITLARFGRLKSGKETRECTASRKLLDELGLTGAQREQKQEQFDYHAAEKLSGCLISLSPTTSRSKTIKCNFELPVPSYLPATTALPSVQINYAIFATCTLPNGKTLQSSQNLHITRKNVEPTRLEPSSTVSYPESPLAVRVTFDTPALTSKNITIPSTLYLQGLNLPSTTCMRPNETRWLVPREIRWELKETAVLLTGTSDTTGHLPMATAQRSLHKRTLTTGKQKLKLSYPFTARGTTHTPSPTSLLIPFTLTAPPSTSLDTSTALTTADAHILHTVLSSIPSTHPQRFALHIEYTLHVWLRIGEDVFDAASGDLVNRKMDEMAYTVVCPLVAQGGGGGEMLGGLPRYDGVGAAGNDAGRE